MLEMTQAEYARHRGVTKQAIHKLVKSGRIALTARKLIDAAAADRTLGETRERVSVEDEAPVAPRGGGGSSFESGGLTKAKTATEVYRARLAQLDYDERIGRLVRTDDVTRAMEICAEAIVRDVDRLPARAEDLIAAFTQGGIGGLRLHLKEIARHVRATLEANMRLLGREAAETEEDALA